MPSPGLAGAITHVWFLDVSGDSPTVSTRGAKASATDHMDALAQRFHPHRAPRFDWEQRRWTWVAPWQDPRTPDRDAEVLGETWEEAARTLFRLAARLRCPHNVPTVNRCDQCRADIVSVLHHPKGT